MNDITKAIASAVAGGLIGWCSNALTLQGRVDAIEKGLARVEVGLQQLVNQRMAQR